MMKGTEMPTRSVTRINERLPLKPGDLELTSRGMIEHLENGLTRPYKK